MINLFTKSYRDLTHLTLHMGSFEAIAMPLVYADLTGLGYFLASLTALQSLELILPYSVSHPERCYKYDGIFKTEDGRWPKLHTLKLYNIAISTTEIVSLFADALPSMRSLAISAVMLLDGRWEWIIEFMRKRMQLDTFAIGLLCGLLYSDGGFYGDDQYDCYQTEEYDRHLGSVLNYVLHGGHHPSIMDFSDDEVGDDEEDDQNSEAHQQHHGRYRHVRTEMEKEAEAAAVSHRYTMELQHFLRKEV